MKNIYKYFFFGDQLDEKEIEEYSRLREELAARTATDRMVS